MAPKRNSRRKARTEVSSPSSSESEAASSEQSGTNRSASPDSHDGEPSDAEPVFTKKAVNKDTLFGDWYLQQATTEFANDLEKLRSASDFNMGSIPMLVTALKQGTACFTSEERAKVGVAISTAKDGK